VGDIGNRLGFCVEGLLDLVGGSCALLHHIQISGLEEKWNDVSLIGGGGGRKRRKNGKVVNRAFLG